MAFKNTLSFVLPIVYDKTNYYFLLGRHASLLPQFYPYLWLLSYPYFLVLKVYVLYIWLLDLFGRRGLLSLVLTLPTLCLVPMLFHLIGVSTLFLSAHVLLIFSVFALLRGLSPFLQQEYFILEGTVECYRVFLFFYTHHIFVYQRRLQLHILYSPLLFC